MLKIGLTGRTSKRLRDQFAHAREIDTASLGPLVIRLIEARGMIRWRDPSQCRGRRVVALALQRRDQAAHPGCGNNAVAPTDLKNSR